MRMNPSQDGYAILALLDADIGIYKKENDKDALENRKS